ncbi:MAG: segregation/condensation protein A [Acetilactobacillus jinshanensis]
MQKDEPKVHLNQFNGPLELLLKLIQRDKMNIYDIQISAITAQYLKYLHHLKSLDLNVVGDFLVMATKLMAIKSRMLLPKRKSYDDEDDPR